MARATPATQPRTPLTKERVLHAAVALAERNGIEAMTMRKLADELGVGAMTLYYHVPNKEQLLDAMVDIVFGEIELPTTDVDWRTAMRRRALSTRAVLNRHRWAVGLMESRLTPGPNSLRLHDAVLGCLGRPASRSRRRSRPTPSRTPTSTALPSRNGASRSRAPKSAAVAEKQNRGMQSSPRSVSWASWRRSSPISLRSSPDTWRRSATTSRPRSCTASTSSSTHSSCAVRRPELAGPNDDELVDA